MGAQKILDWVCLGTIDRSEWLGPVGKHPGFAEAGSCLVSAADISISILHMGLVAHPSRHPNFANISEAVIACQCQGVGLRDTAFAFATERGSGFLVQKASL